MGKTRASFGSSPHHERAFQTAFWKHACDGERHDLSIILKVPGDGLVESSVGMQWEPSGDNAGRADARRTLGPNRNRSELPPPSRVLRPRETPAECGLATLESRRPNLSAIFARRIPDCKTGIRFVTRPTFLARSELRRKDPWCLQDAAPSTHSRPGPLSRRSHRPHKPFSLPGALSHECLTTKSGISGTRFDASQD